MIIIYYDKNLKNEENMGNFIQLREALYGEEVYGVNTFDKFKYLISLFSKTNQNYYIISSGSCAKEFLSSEYFEKKRIIDFYIYCFDKSKYLPLMKEYSSISMIEDINFDNVLNKIKLNFSNPEIKDILKHCSSFLLEKEYYGKPLETHKKLYKYFDEDYNKPSFDENIKNNILDILQKIAQTKDDYETAKCILENIYNEVDLIKSYTAESIIYKFLNKCLREVDDKFIEFAGLLNYALFKYYFDHPEIKITEDMTFYRKLVISIKDLYSYEQFEGKIICFPSFTSTTIDPDLFYFSTIKNHKLSMYSKIYTLYGSGQHKEFKKEKCVLLKIKYKYNESNFCPAFNINLISNYENEKEFLFPPFTFFRICKFISAEGTSSDPVIIELEIIPTKENLGIYLKEGGKIIYEQNQECMIWDGNDEEKIKVQNKKNKIKDIKTYQNNNFFDAGLNYNTNYYLYINQNYNINNYY